MQYITYTDYQQLGGDLPEPDFIRQEWAARKEIDYHTFDRLQNIDPIPDELKMCSMELIQRGLCGDLNGDDFVSQGSGKLSGIREDRRGRAADITRKYLDGLSVNGIPVFYLGN